MLQSPLTRIAALALAFCSQATLIASNPTPPAAPPSAPSDPATPPPPTSPTPPAPDAKTPSPPSGPSAKRPATREQARKKVLEKFDKDGDGILNEDERAAAKAEAEAKMLERFDADGDGKLSESERAAARGTRRGEGTGKPATPPPATENPTKPSPDATEKTKGKRDGKNGPIRARLLKRFDIDGDGKLSDSERAAAKEARRKQNEKKPQ